MPVISHDEIMAFLHRDRSIIPILNPDIRVRFVDRLPVNVQSIVHNLNSLARQSDDPFDQILINPIPRIFQYNNVSPMRLIQIEDRFIDEQPLPILERRFHRTSFNRGKVEYELMNNEYDY